MLLSELLHAGVIRTSLSANDKTAAIEELVDVLVEAHEIPLAVREHVITVVKAREDQMSTGMEHGIALPHASSDKVEDIVAAMAVLKTGIEFESLDGMPARILILLVMPRRNFQGHVSTLAGIAHLMNNAAFRESLLKAGDVNAIVKLIEDAEDHKELQAGNA